MAWYHWITTYIIIISAFLFIVIPEKSVLFVLFLFATALLSSFVAMMFPGKEDNVLIEHKEKFPEQYR